MRRSLPVRLKGAFYAFCSALCVSLVYVVSKRVMLTMSTTLFLFWWFTLAAFWALFIVAGKMAEIKRSLPKIKAHPYFFVYLVVSEVLGTFLFFYIIKRINPAIFSFIGSLTPFFVVLTAFFIIKERLTRNEILGGLISLGGVLLITYVSPEIPPAMLLLSLGTVVVFALSNVLIRKAAGDVPPLLMMLIRITALLISYWGYMLATGGIRLPGLRESGYLLLGSLVGPILGVLTLYSGLKYAKASVVASIKNTQPFLVVIMTYFLLKTPITGEQLLGGTVIVAGISLLLKAEKQ